MVHYFKLSYLKYSNLMSFWCVIAFTFIKKKTKGKREREKKKYHTLLRDQQGKRLLEIYLEYI